MKTEWMLRIGLCAPAVLWPSMVHASHCEGCTEPRPVAVEVAPTQLAPNAPLLVILHRGPTSPSIPFFPSVWDEVDLSVRDSDGRQISGSWVEESSATQLWWPDAPWAEGTYIATTRVLETTSCVEMTFETSFEVLAHSPPPAALDVAAQDRTRIPQTRDNFVCCDGASPYQPDPLGAGCAPPLPPLDWLDGDCTALTEDAAIRVTASLPPELEGHYVLRERTLDLRPESGALQLVAEFHAPTCLTFEVVDVRTGEVTTTPWCSPDEPLGVRALEVDAWIDATCEGPAYVCPNSGAELCDGWPDGAPIDPTAPQDVVTPAPGDEPRPSGGCSTTGAPPSAPMLGLGVLGLGLLGLRRRLSRGTGRGRS